MRFILLSAAVVLADYALASPIAQRDATGNSSDLSSYMKGFKNATIGKSAGGQATCISGFIEVTASAENYQLNISEPANQTALTELILETVQINSTLAKRIRGGTNTVSGTFDIYSKLCFPDETVNTTSLQFLIHGAGFGASYWDVAPGYSYVDYAAAHGYTTFSYDRLGYGASDHPDPIQTVQFPLEVAIAHELNQQLRNGAISGQSFQHIIGVGHSLGSFQTNWVTALHPLDFDAVALTGFSSDGSGERIAYACIDFSIASQNQPLRFQNLQNGYITSQSFEGAQFFFFRAPEFDPAILNLADQTKQTIALGELFTSGAMVATNFTGPFIVVNGMNDVPVCDGDCTLPYNKVATVKDAFYPAAQNSSTWYLQPNTGHGVNFHYTATQAYDQITNFLASHGF